MNELRRFIIFFIQISSVYTACTMPKAWLGSWYQRGMNSLLEITIDYIQTKGLCLDVLPNQQYYLFTDQSLPCTRCLKFIQRHINLLQYRESECIDTDGVLNITSCPHMIAPDAVLYTLHRNDSKPQLCPIQPPYILTNLIRDHSVCNQSLSSSYINQCANVNQFHLHLSSCSSSQSDLQFICVGTWIENRHTYFVTRIFSHQNNQYACFRFLNSSPIFSLHMATDDSCHDLYSRQMSTVMTLLSSTNHSMNNPSCTFPIEFQSYEWYSINRTIRMIIKKNNIELIGINKRFHCHEIISSEKSIRIYRVQTYTDCHMKEECLRIVHPTDNILELSTVLLSKENRCNHPHHPNFYSTFYTQSSVISSSSCPNYIGHLLYQSSIDYYLKRKFYHMSIGCQNKQNIIISENEKDLIIQIDTCLASWRSDDHLTTYLLAQSRYLNTSYCLSFQMTNPIMIRNNSQQCSFHSHEDIKIYSARMIHPCSHSSKISSQFLLFIVFLFYHSKH